MKTQIAYITKEVAHTYKDHLTKVESHGCLVQEISKANIGLKGKLDDLD